MSSDTYPSLDRHLEIRILNEIASIRKKISSLEHEEASLQKILQKVRQENLSRNEINRKDSISRIVVENEIKK